MFRSNLFKGLRFPKAEPLAAFRRKRNLFASENAGRGEKTVRWTVFEGVFAPLRSVLDAVHRTAEPLVGGFPYVPAFCAVS